MKNLKTIITSIIILTMSINMFSQKKTYINRNLQFNKLDQTTIVDSLMVLGSDKIMKRVNYSDLLTKLTADIPTGGGYPNPPTFLSLTIDGSNTAPWDLTSRDVGTSFPVPTIIPKTANTSVAFDIMPRGTATASPGNGVAWMDICDTDILTTNGMFKSARVGIRDIGAEFGLRHFNGSPAIPIFFNISPGGGVDKIVHWLNVDGSQRAPFYGQGNMEAGNLTKTPSNYIARFATDGTIMEEILTTTINQQSEVTANYTVQTTDLNQTIWLNSATPFTVTVDNTLPDNFECFFYNQGSGTVTFTQGTSVLSTPDGASLTIDKTAMLIKRQNNNDYKLKGELE